jgi:hypothetical protein
LSFDPADQKKQKYAASAMMVAMVVTMGMPIESSPRHLSKVQTPWLGQHSIWHTAHNDLGFSQV